MAGGRRRKRPWLKASQPASQAPKQPWNPPPASTPRRSDVPVRPVHWSMARKCQRRPPSMFADTVSRTHVPRPTTLHSTATPAFHPAIQQQPCRGGRGAWLRLRVCMYDRPTRTDPSAIPTLHTSLSTYLLHAYGGGYIEVISKYTITKSPPVAGLRLAAGMQQLRIRGLGKLGLLTARFSIQFAQWRAILEGGMRASRALESLRDPPPRSQNNLRCMRYLSCYIYAYSYMKRRKRHTMERTGERGHTTGSWTNDDMAYVRTY